MWGISVKGKKSSLPDWRQFLKPFTLNFLIFMQAKLYKWLLNSLIEWCNTDNSAVAIACHLSTYHVVVCFFFFSLFTIYSFPYLKKKIVKCQMPLFFKKNWLFISGCAGPPLLQADCLVTVVVGSSLIAVCGLLRMVASLVELRL